MLNDYDQPYAALPNYHRVLWLALVALAAMFVVEVEVLEGAGSGSVSLLAEAINFFGEVTNYGVSLAVLAPATLWQAYTTVFKAMCITVFGWDYAGGILLAVVDGPNVTEALACAMRVTAALR